MGRERVLLFNRHYLDEYRDLINSFEESKDLEIYFAKTEEEVQEFIGRATILFTSNDFPYKYLSKGEELGWIQFMDAGLDRLLESKAVGRDFFSKVLVSRSVGSYNAKMAEYVLGYMLFFAQNISRIQKQQQEKKWESFWPEWLEGKTVGIGGVGVIGGAVASYLRNIGMTVFGLTRKRSSNPSLHRSFLPHEIQDFVHSLDYLVLVLPLTHTTRGMFDYSLLSQMKSSAVLINIGRGPIVQEEALIRVLKEKRIKGAVLDVFPTEPLPEGHPFWEMENVMITPHLSGPSVPENILVLFRENLKAYQRGEKLKGIVDPDYYSFD